jgi:hypothetical protein
VYYVILHAHVRDLFFLSLQMDLVVHDAETILQQVFNNAMMETFLIMMDVIQLVKINLLNSVV